MIKSIERINNFGIYKDYQKQSDLHDFAKFNLIYGWNGSGKSTLSKLFAIINNDIKTSDFKDSQYEFKLEDGSKIYQDTEESNLLMTVFNSNFINDNIDWNDTVKSILLISEEKIEEQKKIKEYEIKRQEIVKLKKDLKDKYDNLYKSNQNFLSSTAKHVKERFKIIDTSDKYYLNYNRTRLEKFIEVYKDKVQSVESLLTEEESINVTKSIKPESKSKIDFVFNTLDEDLLIKGSERIKTLINTSIINQTVQSLKDNEVISHWVEEGFKLHSGSITGICEFCGQLIPSSRLEELEKHFNDEYQQFKEKLITAKEWVRKQMLNSSNEKALLYSLYEEFYDAFNNQMNILTLTEKNINDKLENWVNVLDKKNKNPFEKLQVTELDEISISLLQEYNTAIVSLNEIIKLHNYKFENYQTKTKEQKHKLELSYTAEALKEYDYFYAEEEKNNIKLKIQELDSDLNMINQSMFLIEKELSNESLGAEEFNKQLQLFIGHNEISLEFDKLKKGYRILRTRTREAAKNLSEGEKTALAFVYFITKLREKGNEISNQIIVIDDPISSFDSNNLFSAYAFLRAHCQEAKQLFVLTHNFVFFKLCRDWMLGKNKRDKVKSRCYAIESIGESSERRSFITNAKDALIKYNSEYHYLFHKVYSFKRSEELSLDEAFLVSNLSRKLLEGFLTFKFPKKRNDFNQLLEAAISDVQRRERVYRFINKYSHNATIEFSDNAIDNLLGESKNIVDEIMDVIKELDMTHYSEMESLVIDNL
ncbi:AAA family ATPase [Terribacillus sp. JSM ZJ617]|uniref:AAA family ATPase n=1 Tax=Terribacillus sp. JSM ZJ617 TaxID=3342119 RepID=UPI0035A83F87